MTTSGDRRVDWKWIDGVSFVSEDDSLLRAHRRLLPSEWYFEHHFECFPVLPGVLLIEMMAHAAGYLQILRFRRATSRLAHYFLAGANNSRFYRQVPPGSLVELSASVKQGDEDQVLMGAEAAVDGRRVARTEVILQRIEGDWLEAQDEVLERTLRRVLPDPLKIRYHFS